MSDHHVVCSTVLSTLSSSFSAYFKTDQNVETIPHWSTTYLKPGFHVRK